MSRKRPRRFFTREFKVEAVALVKRSGRSVGQIARELDLTHPSGIATPYEEDIEITRRLKEGAELLGVRFLDHIIIGNGGYVVLCR